MNIFNRIIVVILLIFLIAVSALGILNTFVKWTTGKTILDKITGSFTALRSPYAIAVFVLIIIFCIFLLILEFYRRRSKTAVVAAVKEGTALITLDSIAGQLKDNLATIGGTRDLSVRVIPKSRGVIINIFSKICEDCNIPSKMQEIIKTATDFATNKLGLKVVKTNLTIINLTNVGLETGTSETRAASYTKPETITETKTAEKSVKDYKPELGENISGSASPENSTETSKQDSENLNGDGEEGTENSTDES